jgi:hypothetical protein
MAGYSQGDHRISVDRSEDAVTQQASRFLGMRTRTPRRSWIVNGSSPWPVKAGTI